MNYLEKISENLTKSIGTPISIIGHTIFFIGIFSLQFLGYTVEQILLILTTAVSLEAIYLSIFIQMTINKANETIAAVGKDIDEIQEDVEDIQEDVEDLGNDVKEISDDYVEDEEDDDEIIKAIKDIEKRLTVLHKEIVKINDKKIN